MTAPTPRSLPASIVAEAETFFGPGDSLDPHDGKTTDLNVDGGWLLLDPDPSLDPARPPAPQESP